MVRLPATPPTPPTAQLTPLTQPTRSFRVDVAGVAPETLRAYIERAKRGDTEYIADVFEEMLFDDQVRAVWESRLDAVVSGTLHVSPSPDDDPSLASEVAEFTRELLQAAPFAETTGHGMRRVSYGWTVIEHDWVKRGGIYYSLHQNPVEPRDVRFREGWRPEVKVGDGKWAPTTLEPRRWIAATAASVGAPAPLSGVFHAAVWKWLFKKWATTFQQIGLDRYANPLAVGKVLRGADQSTRQTMLNALASLRADLAAVIEEGQSIDLLEAKRSTTDSWMPALNWYDQGITKAILGSTLNTEISSAGGNRATAESQGSLTILPRLKKDAREWIEIVGAQWVKPALTYNARLFGYRPVHLPKMWLELAEAAAPVFDELMLRARAGTKDELRRSRGWPELGPGKGGDEIATDVQLKEQAEAFGKGALDEGGETTTAPEVSTEPTPTKPTPDATIETPTDAPPVDDVQKTALNGAQVTALAE